MEIAPPEAVDADASGEPCPRCGEDVAAADRVVVDGLPWHRWCRDTDASPPHGGHPVQALIADVLTNGDDDPEAKWETQQQQALYDSRAMERFAPRHLVALGGAYWVYSAAHSVLLEHEAHQAPPIGTRWCRRPSRT